MEEEVGDGAGWRYDRQQDEQVNQEANTPGFHFVKDG
jgi:hypothetical protein